MATLSEWLEGRTRYGLLLPLGKVNEYRARHGIAPKQQDPEYAAPRIIQPPPSTRFARGVGTHLKLLLKELGVNSDLCGEGCGSFAAQMDEWGIEGCKQNREAILERLRQRYKETSWKTSLNAAWQTVISGKVFDMNILHPLEWLVDEAVRRAEAEAIEARQSTPHQQGQ